jgi:chaperonin GroES
MAKKAKKATRPASKNSKQASPSVKTAPQKVRVSSVPIMPLGDRVLVREFTPEEMGTRSPSGIIIPTGSKEEKSDRGVIISVGAGKRNEKGERVPLDVKEGDKILFQWGEKVEVGGKEYYLVREDNILAVLES